MRKYITLFFLLACASAGAETIANQLLQLNQTKTDIGAAIASKGASVSGLEFTRYDEAIASIGTPEAFPIGLEEDNTTVSDSIYDILDTDQRQIPGLTYCGNGICLAYVWLNAGAGAKIYRSTNYGVTFPTVAYSPAGTLVNIIYDGAYCGDGIVIAPGGHSANKNVFRSTDYGTSWTPVAINSTDTYFLCVEYLGSNTVAVGTSGGGAILLSTDKGLSFTVPYDSDKANIQCIENMGNGMALAGANGDSEGLFKTTNYGVTWSPVNTSFNASAVSSLCYCGNGRILAGTLPTGCIYLSDDYGDTWSLATDTNESIIYALEYCENAIVYAGTGPNGLILKSSNRGASGTWSIIGDTAPEQVTKIKYMGGDVALYGNGYPIDNGNGIIGRMNIGRAEVKRW